MAHLHTTTTVHCENVAEWNHLLAHLQKTGLVDPLPEPYISRTDDPTARTVTIDSLLSSVNVAEQWPV